MILEHKPTDILWADLHWLEWVLEKARKPSVWDYLFGEAVKIRAVLNARVA